MSSIWKQRKVFHHTKNNLKLKQGSYDKKKPMLISGSDSDSFEFTESQICQKVVKKCRISVQMFKLHSKQPDLLSSSGAQVLVPGRSGPRSAPGQVQQVQLKDQRPGPGLNIEFGLVPTQQTFLRL